MSTAKPIIAGGGFGLREEDRRILLRQEAQRGPLRAVACAVDRGATRRPVGLRTNQLHAFLIREPWCFTDSNRASRRHCFLWRLLAGARFNVSALVMAAGISLAQLPAAPLLSTNSETIKMLVCHGPSWHLFRQQKTRDACGQAGLGTG